MKNLDFASRFRQLRTTLGLSQGELARAIGKTSSFIALIEAGKSNVSSETVSSLCQTYHVNSDWLLNGTGEMFAPGYELIPPDRKGIPDRIKQIRKGQNLTQGQFAREIDCSQGQISSVEQGKTNPSNDLLKKISSRFHVSYRWLLSGAGEIEESSPSAEDDLKMIYQFLSSDETARSVVMEAIQSYSVHKDASLWERVKETINQ